MHCPVCSAPTSEFAQGQVLGDQDVFYRRCDACGFVFAADPVWLERSYADAITKFDVGLLDRSVIMSNIVAALLRALGLREGTFLDWAGGYGTLTRLLRDRGYDFRHYEPNAKNIFAEGFASAPEGSSFALVTAIEVLEHLPDPVASLTAAAQSSDLLLTTTQVLPEPAPKPGEWWYYAPETGQHISFYSRPSLEALAEKLGYDGVVTGSFVHLFYRGRVPASARWIVRHTTVSYLWGGILTVTDRRRSLTQSDMELAKRY
jgi:hypothetical protein